MALSLPWQRQDKLRHFTHRHTCLPFTEICLATARTATCLSAAYKTPGGAVIFKCNFIAKKTKSAVASLQVSDSLLLSQTDRACYLISNRQGRPQKNSSLSMGSNSRAISRPHYI